MPYENKDKLLSEEVALTSELFSIDMNAWTPEIASAMAEKLRNRKSGKTNKKTGK